MAVRGEARDRREPDDEPEGRPGVTRLQSHGELAIAGRGAESHGEERSHAAGVRGRRYAYTLAPGGRHR